MRRWPLLLGVLACGCADRSFVGYGIDGDTETGEEGLSSGEELSGDGDGDGGDPDGDGGEDDGGTAEPPPTDDPEGPYLEGLPSACTEAPSAPMHATLVTQYQEFLAGFAVSPLGAAAVTSLEAYFWKLTVVCPDGTLAWRVDLPVEEGQPFVGGVAFGPGGDVWVSGANFVDGSFERMIARYSVDGELRWALELPGTAYPEIQMVLNPMLTLIQYSDDPGWGPAGYAEQAIDIEVAADGRAFVTGAVDDAIRGNDVWVAAVDADGELLWEQTSGRDDQCESGMSLDLDADGIVIAEVHAASCEDGNPLELIVSRRDLSGALVWQTAIDAGDFHRTWHVATRDGLTIVGGSITLEGSDHSQGRLLALDADGDVMWEIIDDNPWSWTVDVDIDAGGRILVSGGHGIPAHHRWIRGYDATGGEVDSLELVGTSLIGLTGDDAVYAVRHFTSREDDDGHGWFIDELDA